MQEADWLNSTDPQAMLTFLRETGKLSERKARLFAVACCRRIWHLLTDERSRRAVEAAESSADGCCSRVELEAAYYAANAALVSTDSLDECYHAAAELACYIAYPVVSHGCSLTADAARAVADTVADPTVNAAAYRAAKVEELTAQCSLLRDIFANPFRPRPPIAPSLLIWQDGLVRRLAKEASEKRQLPAGTLDPTRLAVLADALEEAGCDDADIIGHLRGPGPHVHGCWAMGLLRHKE